MTSWGVYPHGQTFFSGSEVDFIESIQVPGLPRSYPAVGDTVTIEWPDGKGEAATITLLTNDQITITIKTGSFALRPPTPEDTRILSPMKSKLRVDPWFVV